MKSVLARSIAVTMACAPMAALSLSEDRDKPMTVESNHAELDRNTNVGTYTGDVIIIQGTFELNADRVVVTATDAETPPSK